MRRPAIRATVSRLRGAASVPGRQQTIVLADQMYADALA